MDWLLHIFVYAMSVHQVSETFPESSYRIARRWHMRSGSWDTQNHFVIARLSGGPDMSSITFSMNCRNSNTQA